MSSDALATIIIPLILAHAGVLLMLVKTIGKLDQALEDIQRRLTNLERKRHADN